LLVSTTAGAALLFETDFSAVSVSAGSTRRARALASARAAEGAGEYEQARRLLLPVVKAHPHDLEAAAYLDELTCRLIERRRGEAATRAREGRLREALEALEAAAALDPWSEALFRERAEYRRRACEECQARALAAEARADWASAFLAWQEGLTLDSAWTEARAEMGRLRRRQAEELMHKGEGRREAGDLAGAAALWRQALELASRPEWETRLRELEGERCLQAGIAHFEARRMPEALFQLRKVLVLDPGNREAARYLRYAEQPADDGTIQDRFRRLED